MGIGLDWTGLDFGWHRFDGDWIGLESLHRLDWMGWDGNHWTGLNLGQNLGRHFAFIANNQRPSVFHHEIGQVCPCDAEFPSSRGLVDPSGARKHCSDHGEYIGSIV